MTVSKFKVGDIVVRTSGFDTDRWITLPESLKKLPYFTVSDTDVPSCYCFHETGGRLFEGKYFSKSEPLDYDGDDDQCV